MSRHHILPPIVYTPAPPKPKETRRRRGVGFAQGTGDVDETEETSDVSNAAPARGAAALPQHSIPVEAAERRLHPTTGNLSDGTLNMAILNFGNDDQLGKGPDYVGLHHFGVLVDDLASARKHVEALGGDCFRHTPPPGHTGFYETKFHGPDGVVFDISEHPWPGLSAEDKGKAKVKAEAAE